MNSSRYRASGVAAALLATAAITVPYAANAQQSYRNISNQRFRAVGNGPQSGIIVDVKDANDVAGVRRAVDSQVRAAMRVHTALLEREIAVLRQRHILRPGHELPLVQMVQLRQNGRLVSARNRRERTRDVPGSNELTFSQPTGFNTTDTTSTSYTTLQAILAFMQQQNGQPALYQELKKILGQPFSNSNVVIRNVDPDDPGKNISVRGVIIEPPTTADPNIYIDFPSFHSPQDAFLGLAQALTQAFYVTGAGGSNSFGFDAYTQGIARATACIAAQDFTANGFFTALNASIDPVPSFYYTPYYDLLNQPALGNNTFFPPTPSGLTLGGLAGMIVPRLQMASTAWTKCYIEDPQFFIKFNNMYYDEVTADSTVANNAGRLSSIAANALPNGVEGIAFATWFQQQYIFDTSVTPGPKLFVYMQPTQPDSASDAGASVFLVYYATTTSGDEKALSGVVNPVYFDYKYTSRLVLASGNAQEPINNGNGQASPFFSGIGGDTPGDDKQRLAIDFPVSSSQANPATPGGNEYVRVYFPANEESVSNAPTNFSGVVIGALSGYFQVTFNGGSGTLSGGDNGGTAVTGAGINGTGFGAFNGTDTGSAIPTGFHKVTINFRPSNTNTSLVFQRNVFTRKENAVPNLFGVSPVFVLNTGLSQASLTLLKHTFNYGPQMVALPFQPYQPYISNLPLLFSLGLSAPDANAQLIAQYRQDADPNTGKYVRYPSLPPYQPGYSFWTNFAGGVNNIDLSAAGESTDNKDLISVPLQFGWNMIGNPYTIPLVYNPNSTDAPGIQIQYQNGDALTLQEAVNAGYVAAGLFGYNSANGVAAYQDITISTPGGLPQNTLQPWTGYWLRVLVTEGVTLSYFNPSLVPGSGGGRASSVGGRSLKKTRASRVPVTGVGEWQLPLVVRNASGNATSALLGQSTRGADTFVPSLDAANPPPFAQSASLSIRFPHADWDTGKASSSTGDFLSDIRRTGAPATWNLVVNTPQSEQPYVLTWNNTARLPRGLRLTLTDMETGTRQLMNTGVSYTFTPARGVTSRKFQIQAEPRTPGRLFVSNLRVDSHITRGTTSSATISYEVSGASETTIEIHNGTGHVVRRLASGRAATTGINQVFWDLKDDKGRALATGTYMVSISVRTPEGEQARSIIAHPITR